MAINKNHEFEDLDGVKCSIVERNIPRSRVGFLKAILEENGYTVVMAKSPPKTVKVSVADSAAGPSDVSTDVEVAELLTLGVTDVTFNPINAIFGRLLRTRDGKVVTLTYWNQQDLEPDDNEPYFKKQ